MPLLSRTLLIAAAFCLVTAPAWAGKVPYQPEELESESKLIVSGKVESFEKKVTANQDGSKTATITLKIAVDKVHKGDAKAGDVIEATAWRVVKMPRPGIILWDSGNDFIPAVGVKAKFFLEGNTNNVWPIMWPNGVLGLDNKVAVLSLPVEPTIAAPADAPAGNAAAQDEGWFT